MPSHYRNPPAILGVLVLILCLGTDLAAQSPYAPATAGDSIQQQPQPQIRKFTFKQARAADVLEILQQLAGPTDHIGLKIAVDERTNSLVFQPDDDRQSREFEETCTLLDADTPTPGDTGNGVSISVPALGPTPQQQSQVFTFSMGFERSESIETLKKQYNELEQQTHQIADKLKQIRSKSPSEPERTELKTAVRKSFEARQALQRAELADLARRMKSMQQSIDLRDKLADKVVQRRVEDLLDPNLNWDAGKVIEQLLAGPNQGSSNSAMPLPPSPFPSNVSVPSIPEERPSTVIKKRMQGRWLLEYVSSGNEESTVLKSSEQSLVQIEGNIMKLREGNERDFPILLVDCEDIDSSQVKVEGPLPIDLVFDPNSDSAHTHHGIIACDGETLSICMAGEPQTIPTDDFRPKLLVAGSRVTLWKFRRAPADAAKADVSNETDSISPSLSSTQAAVTRLLAQLPHFATPQGDVDTAPIAFLGIDYQGPWSLGDFRDELQKEIEAQISQSSSCSLVSRRMSDYAMMETRAKPTDVVTPEIRQKLTQSLRNQGIKVQGLMFARLKHLGDSDSTRNGEFEVSLELFDINQHSYKERATARNDRSSSDSRKKEPQLLQGRWIIESWSREAEDQLSNAENQFELRIDGHAIHVFDDVGNQYASMLVDDQNIEPAAYNGIACPVNYVIDPNGDRIVCPGILELDGERLRICFNRNNIKGVESDEFRPSLFLPGSKVTLIECRRAEPETAKAVSVDHPIWKSQVQQATSKLLAAFPVPPAMDQNDFPKVIAIVEVDYQGKQEAGNLKEEMYEWIAADIPFAPRQGSYALLSRSAVKLAMQETRLRPRDLARSSPNYIDNRQKLLNQLRSHELKVDALLTTSLKQREDLQDPNQNQFEITLEGFIDARTTNWLERVNVNGKAQGQSSEPLSNSLPQFDSPQALLSRVDEHGKSGSYEDFVTLFNDEGVRDLAGSLLMSALQLTGSVDLAKNQGAEASSGTDSGVAAVSEVFKRWLPQSANAEQLKAMRDGLTTMLNALGGASPDQSALQAYVISMRKSVEGIGDHRKFCVEMMRAYEKLTTKPFVYFGNSERQSEWQVSGFGDRAIATLVDGSPGMATTITLQQATGTWRISSLFNELVKVTKEDESGATPSTPAAAMQQRLQGQWDVKIISFSAGDPKELVIRDDLVLLPGNLLGKPILISMKLEWPNPNQLDEVDIIWEPNDQQAGYVINRLVGRIRCDGEKLQLCFVDGSGKVTSRPREMCGGDGIFYLECMRKRVSDSSKPLKDENLGANSLLGPTYSGRPISWWLDTYWENTTANPKSRDNEMEEMVAMEAIRKLRELPESNPFIEAVLAKWFASVEHELNDIQLVQAAKCIVFAAGPKNQKLAVEYLFKIWTRLPKPNLEKLVELAGEETELKDLLQQLILNDELAIQFAERLKNGTSFDRSLVTHYLLMVESMGLVNDKDPKVVELNAWYQKHNELFFNAFEAASKDQNEEVRWFALGGLAGRNPQHVSILSTLTAAIESDSSNRVRSMAIDLLTRNDVKSVAKSQNIELAPILVKTLESDTSIDVRYSALGALMQMDAASELVHSTLLKWAKSQDRVEVNYALTMMLRNQADGGRPQSIDELIELLSDPEWGTAVEVAENNWETYHRWARQYAIAILGRYAAHAHCALPTLEAELARNSKETLSFATKALDSVRGYCPDRPIDQLQGQWEFVSVNRPNSTTAFFDFPLHDGGVYPAVGRELRTASDQLPASIITVRGTQLKLGDRVLAEISHQRQNLEVVMLLDPDGKKRHCNGRYELIGGPSPEYKPNAAPAPELLILEVCELRNDSDTTQATKQTFEFRPVKK